MEPEGLIRIIDGKPCVSTAFLAYAFEVSKQTIAAWGRKGCPKVQQGFWYMPEVLRWREGGLESASGGDEEELPLEKQKLLWEMRLKKAQAKNRQFQNDEARRKYVKSEEATKELASFFGTFKQSVLSLPQKMGVIASAQMDYAQARALEREAMEVVLDALRQWNDSGFWEEAPGLDQQSPGGLEASREDDGK